MSEKARVLYVDDDRANLTSFRFLFQNHYDIHLAQSADEAMKLMRRYEFHVVLSDQRMPVMTGAEFLERVREKYPRTFRMIVTGYSDIDAVIDAINHGHIYYFFKKPWNENEIRMVIDNALATLSLEKNNEKLLEELKVSNKVLKKELKLRKQAEKALNFRVRQQASAAEISRIMLSEGRLDQLMYQVLRCVSDTLAADSCTILELQPDGVSLLLRAGYGWLSDKVGKLIISTEQDSPIGLTVKSLIPVSFEDLTRDERFKHLNLQLKEHGMISGASVCIRNDDGIWGTLSVHNRKKRHFSQEDINYLQVVAKIVADAVKVIDSQEKLQRNEEKFRGLLEAAPDGIVIADKNNDILIVNAVTETMTGWGRDELIGQSLSVLFPDLQIKKDRALETRALRKDGSNYPAEISMCRLITEEGLIVSIFLRDVTSRKQSEDELKKSERQLREAQHLAHLGFWEWDIPNQEVYWSDELYKIACVDPNTFEVNYVNNLSLVHPDDRKSYKQFFKSVFRLGKVSNYEHRIHLQGDEVRYLSVEAELICDADDTPVRMLGTVMDITDRKLAEQALQRANDELEQRVEERTRELYLSKEKAETMSAIADNTLQNMGQGIIMVDADGNIKIYNDLLSEYTGMEREKMISCHSLDKYLQLIRETGGDENYRREVKYANTRDSVSYEMLSRDGKIVEVRQNPLKDGGFVRTYTNITTLKKVQDDLRKAKDRAESASIAKANFLATMSHEIRTPMNGVIGMTDLLLQSNLDAEQRQMLQTINNCGQALLTIINDILDFSKIEAGKLELETIPMSLTDVVEGSAQTIVHNASRKGLRQLTFIDPDLPQFVVGDPVRVRQILINLGGNAIKFTEQGKVVIRADMIATSEDSEVSVRFSVIDEGIGIQREVLDNLFREFTQAESSTTRKYGGTGLGLSICQRLTEMMNGRIGVNSTPGEGSEFYFTLSFKRCDKIRKHSNVSDLKGLRVLLIVADAVEEEIYRKYLEYWHAEVDTEKKLENCPGRCLDAKKKCWPYHVVVISSHWTSEEQMEMSRIVTEEDEKLQTKFVTLQRGKRRRPRLEGEVCVSLDVDQVRRAGFLSAVSIAAGRASPEIDYEAQYEEIQNIKSARVPSVEQALKQGNLILVAEDNPTNRDVIRRQLNLLGYACEMAEDGRAALSAWHSKNYAILLTDCQMPNMDGFELTETIRTEEEKLNIHAPIIAITANALQGEAERCLAAGMDDYLSKPIDMKELKEKLLQWMPKRVNNPGNDFNTSGSGIDFPQQVQKKKNGSAPYPIDERALKSMFGDDPDTFREILRDFVNPSQQVVYEIQNGWKERCAEDIKMAAHKLKSSARSIGAEKLAEICLTLENAGKASNWEIIDDQVPYLDGLMVDIENYISML